MDSELLWPVGYDVYEVIDPPGKGDCFYAALSYALANEGIYLHHSQIRKATVDKALELCETNPPWFQEVLQVHIQPAWRRVDCRLSENESLGRHFGNVRVAVAVQVPRCLDQGVR